VGIGLTIILSEGAMTEEKVENEINLIDLVKTVWKGKWLILAITLVTTLGTLIFALLQKDEFTSQAVITPITSSSAGPSSLAQYAGLAAMAGVNIPTGGGGDSAAVNNLLVSRSLRDRVIQTLNLTEKLFSSDTDFGKRDPLRVTEEALSKKFITNSKGREGVINLEVKTNDPLLSFEISKQILVELEALLNEYNMAKSQMNISLVEKQLREQSEKLALVQQRMAIFQTKNKLIDPTTQSKGYMELFQTLTAQRIQLEIQLRQMEDAYNPSDSRIQALKGQLDSLKIQIRDLERTGGGIGASVNTTPELLIEYQNLYRDLEIAQRLYATLLASLEQSRLTATEEQVFIRIIDPPLVPDIKSGPNRTLTVALGVISGFVLGVLGIFFLVGVNNIKKREKKNSPD